jgi:hypothetical protein
VPSQVAAAVAKQTKHLMSSTGGPNTLVADRITPTVLEATKLSNLIENKGQVGRKLSGTTVCNVHHAARRRRVES